MKVTITNLKAPWPQGALIGDVVEMPGQAIPGWALGKCTTAADDATLAHAWTPPAPADVPDAKPPLAPGVQDAIDAAVKAAVEPLQALVDDQAKQIAEMKAAATAAVGELTVNPEAGGDGAAAAGSATATNKGGKKG